MSGWRPVARLGLRDARRHWVRTLCAVLLVSVPACALVAAVVATQSGTPSTEAALRRIPQGAQAVVTATAVSPHAGPLAQPPEGLTSWMDDLEREPVPAADIAAELPAANRLLPYWKTPDLLAVAGLGLEPGSVQEAGAATESFLRERRRGIVPAAMREAGPEALSLLLPGLAAGRPPGDGAEAVISRTLAQRLSLGVGDTLTLIAAPWNGWVSTQGRIGAVIANQQKTYRVSGVAAMDAELVWALEGWVSGMVAADTAGVDGHYLVVGPEPVTWDRVKELNRAMVHVLSRHVLVHYPAASELHPVSVDPQLLAGWAVLVAMAAVVGTLLVVFLVTPAFAVSVEQQRRLLALESAIGAAPRDLRRTIAIQGVTIGFAGGLLGALAGLGVGIAVFGMIDPDADPMRHFPWGILPVTVLVTTLLGWVMTLFPAAWAARQDPIGALRPHRCEGSHPPIRGRAVAALACCLAGAASAVASLWMPVPSEEQGAGGSAELHGVLAFLAALGIVGGLLLGLVPVLGLLDRCARRLPLVWRAAISDAARHRSRVVPAMAAVLVSVLGAALIQAMEASLDAAERDRIGRLVDPGHLVLGLRVATADGLDRAIALDAVEELKQRFPVTGSQPVYAFASGQAERYQTTPRCGPAEAPDYPSALEPGHPLRCVPYERGFVPSLSSPWMVGGDIYIMTGAALLAGRPEAVAEAAVLDSGGVLVRDATAVTGGLVSIDVSLGEPTKQQGSSRVARRVSLPGAFSSDIDAPLTLSPDAAQALGSQPQRYVGEVIELSRPLSRAESEAAMSLLAERAPLVFAGSGFDGVLNKPAMWVALAGAVLLAVCATAVATALCRTQAHADLATMHAIGASPAFLRRYLMAQSMLIVGSGGLCGLAGGCALASYLVAWARHVGGGWRHTHFAWGGQAAVLACLVAAALLVSWMASRPPRDLILRVGG